MPSPPGVERIEANAFTYSRALTSVKLPAGLTSIGMAAFTNCERLTGVAVPPGVTKLDALTFSGCAALTDVYFTGTGEQWDAVLVFPLGNGELSGAAVHVGTAGPLGPTVTGAPRDASAEKGSRVSFTAEAEGDGLTWQWYYQSRTADEYVRSACRKPVWTFTAVPVTNGRQLYCEITDRAGFTVRTEPVTLTVTAPLAVTVQPVSAEAEKGGKASFTVKASGDGLTYRWYYKARGADDFTPSVCTGPAWTFTAVAAANGRQIYCEVTDAAGNTVRTDTVTLTLK